MNVITTVLENTSRPLYPSTPSLPAEAGPVYPFVVFTGSLSISVILIMFFLHPKITLKEKNVRIRSIVKMMLSFSNFFFLALWHFTLNPLHKLWSLAEAGAWGHGNILILSLHPWVSFPSMTEMHKKVPRNTLMVAFIIFVSIIKVSFSFIM